MTHNCETRSTPPPPPPGRTNTKYHPVRQWKLWEDLKQENPDALLVFAVGGHYFLWSEDAVVASRELQLPLVIAQDDTGDTLPTAEIPSDGLMDCIAVLDGRGYTVALLEQVPRTEPGVFTRQDEEFLRAMKISRGDSASLAKPEDGHGG